MVSLCEREAVSSRRRNRLPGETNFEGNGSPFFVKEVDDGTGSCPEEIDILGEDCLITAPKRRRSLFCCST